LCKRWEDDLVRDARELLVAVGFGSGEDPWLPLGVGLDIGRAFVGNVGSGEVKDFTAIGDVVNTASRLQSAAAAGQVVLSERLFARLSAGSVTSSPDRLTLKGKGEAEPVRVVELGA
jgi:adenylate cyclase